MSIYGIYDVIADRVNEGKLFHVPHAMGFPLMRRIVASGEINELIVGPWVTQEWKLRCLGLRADLDRFLDGTLINAALPSKDKPYASKPNASMRLLHPWANEIWEIRSTNDKPSIRVFGRFADVNLFIALTWSKRKDLKEPTSRQWRDARVSCKTEWTKLLYPYSPLSGADLHDYISTDAVLI